MERWTIRQRQTNEVIERGDDGVAAFHLGTQGHGDAPGLIASMRSVSGNRSRRTVGNITVEMTRSYGR